MSLAHGDIPLRERFLKWVLGHLRGLNLPGLIPWVFRRVRSLFTGRPDRYFRFLQDCRRDEDWFLVFFAAHELGTLYPDVEEGVLETLEALSAHDNDLVKEAAAHSWSRVLEADFTTGLARLTSLARRPDYASRRTAALAPVRFYEESADPRQKQRLIPYWKQFLDDPRPGLRNLVRTRILERLPEP